MIYIVVCIHSVYVSKSIVYKYKYIRSKNKVILSVYIYKPLSFISLLLPLLLSFVSIWVYVYTVCNM